MSYPNTLPRFPFGAVYFRKTNPPMADWARDYGTASEDGMNLFRHWFLWNAVEIEPGVYSEIGINSRLDALQAMALGIKLRHLDDWTRKRGQLAAHYDALFADRGGFCHEDAASDASTESLRTARLPLQTPKACPAPGRHTYHRYVVRVPADRRAGLSEALEREGIASAVFYPRGLHQQPALAAYAPQSALVETERACREMLALPLFPELGIDRVELVVGAVTRFLES